MIQLIKENNVFNTPIQEYICETTTEMNTVATTAPIFSTAYCLADKKTYILNSSRTWVEK